MALVKQTTQYEILFSLFCFIPLKNFSVDQQHEQSFFLVTSIVVQF